MEHSEMIVTMEDGVRVVFSRCEDEDDEDIVIFIMFNGSAFFQNEVNESTIHAVIGEPLSFDYYYGYGSCENFKTETLVKEIEYKDEE